MGFYGINSYFPVFIVFLIINFVKINVVCQEVKFDQNYVVTYGQDHFFRLGGGTEVQLSLDRASGSSLKLLILSF